MHRNGRSRGKGDKTTHLPARYIATSLYNRLLPRWNYHIVQEADRLNRESKNAPRSSASLSTTNPLSSDHPNHNRPPLHIIAGATDEAFCKRMNYDYVTYMKFKQEAMPRLKFSSQFATWIKTGQPIDVDWEGLFFLGRTWHGHGWFSPNTW